MEKGGSGELEKEWIKTEKGRTRSRKKDWRGEIGIKGERRGAIRGERRRWGESRRRVARNG